jgi:hypothetical protein
MIEEITMCNTLNISRRTRAALAIFAASVCTFGLFQTDPAAAQVSGGDSVIYLDQAWSQADRETYYNTQQGSQVIAYDIFLNLEVANGQELFRSDANSDRYGLIPQAPNPRTNPDGLPIGLTKTVLTEGRWKGETVGTTCALCHDAQLTYQGKKIRIDGGFNHTFDFMSYMFAFDDAIQATLTDASKFDRLATRLNASSADAKSALRKRFESEAARVHAYRSITMLTPVVYGPGRIDAFNEITNRMLATRRASPKTGLRR